MSEVTAHLRSEITAWGGGHFMESWAAYEPDHGRVVGHTTETVTNKLFGFTGGVSIVFYDDDGNGMGESPVNKYGLDNAPFIGANHRTDYWMFPAPDGTSKLDLVQVWAPKDAIDQLVHFLSLAVNEAKKFGGLQAAFSQLDPSAASQIATQTLTA